MLTNPDNQCCAICGENRYTERAHILPKFLFKSSGKNADLFDFKGKNIVLLCPTHHKLYDHHKLNPFEKEKLSKLVYGMIPEMLRIGDDGYLGFSREVCSFYRWFNKFKEIW